MRYEKVVPTRENGEFLVTSTRWKVNGSSTTVTWWNLFTGHCCESWGSLAGKSKPKYVWVVEDDAGFSGNIVDFLSAYEILGWILVKVIQIVMLLRTQPPGTRMPISLPTIFSLQIQHGHPGSHNGRNGIYTWGREPLEWLYLRSIIMISLFHSCWNKLKSYEPRFSTTSGRLDTKGGHHFTMFHPPWRT